MTEQNTAGFAELAISLQASLAPDIESFVGEFGFSSESGGSAKPGGVKRGPCKARCQNVTKMCKYVVPWSNEP